MLHCLGTQTTGVRYLHFSGQPVFDQRKKFKGYRGIARDVSAQIRAERLAQLEYTIAHTLAEADDAAAGLRVVIRAMCEAQSWTAGNFWRVDAQRDTLWHEVGWSSDGDERRSVLTPGERLPPWLSHGPVWIGDVVRDPRTPGLERADATGWHTGLLVPVKAGTETIGVLDFYAPHVAAPEPQFLKLLRSASVEIGHFCQRAIAREKLRESEERVSSTMELAAIGIAHVEADGRFCYVNPQLCTMLGYTEQELLAMTVKDISHLGDASVTDELARAAPLRRDPVVQDRETLSAQGRIGDLGRPHDRQQARPCGRVPVRHLGRGGHLVTQERRRAHSIPRDARRPHGLAESRDVHAAARAIDRDRAALRAQARGAVHRSRPLQGHQRYVGPRGRRRVAARGRGTLARVPARQRRRRAPRRRRVRRAAPGCR